MAEDKKQETTSQNKPDGSSVDKTDNTAPNNIANTRQQDPKQDGRPDCTDPCCFQPQFMYGTYIVLPPVYCKIDCSKHKSHSKQHSDEHHSYHHEHNQNYQLRRNGLQDIEIDRLRYENPNEEETNEEATKHHQEPASKYEVKNKGKCPKKLGTFSFPAKNAMYQPKQTLEGTVLELYKKESYPYNKCKMRRC